MNLWTVDQEGKAELSLHPGQAQAWQSDRRFVFVLAGSQSGKRLPVDELLPTPQGFRRMGDVRPGDQAYDEQGLPCTVIAESAVQRGICYRVTFDDGTTIVADAEHQWLTQDARQRKNESRQAEARNPAWTQRPQCCRGERYSVRTTEEIAESLYVRITKKRKLQANHSVDLTAPVQYPEQDLLIPPYTLGAWLDDGTSAHTGLTCADLEIVERIRQEGIDISKGHARKNQGKALTYFLGGNKADRKRDAQGRYVHEENGVKARLERLGVLGHKHIPEQYLTASAEQRLELLRGLMDTDGCATPRGKGCRCEFTSTVETLAQGVLELCRSLGIKARIKEGRSKLYGRDCGPKWRVFFTTDVKVFHLSRKLERLRPVKPSMKRRFIVAVDPVEDVLCKCISVDSPRHLYLAGRDYVVTHNTAIGPWWLYREIQRHGGGDYLAVTSSYDLFKLKMLPEMRTVFEGLLNAGRWWAGNKIIELREPGGNFWAKSGDSPMWGRIILRSASAEGGLESSTAKAAWLDECGMDGFGLIVWEAVQRRLSLNQGRVLGTTTIYNRGWLKTEVYDRWAAGDETFDIVQFTSAVNPAFPQEEYDRVLCTLPLWKVRMFYQGRFATPPGLIYDCFEPAMHVVDDYALPASWPRIVGVDPLGASTVALWLAYDRTKTQLHVYREYYEPYGRSTAEHVKGVLDLCHGELVIAFVGGGPSERQARTDWTALGIPLQPVPYPSVASGINAAYTLLKGKNLVVHRSCTHLIDELGSYSYATGADGIVNTSKIVNKDRFHCLSGDTSIATYAGMRPLASVTPGTRVLTRKGWRRVTGAACTNLAASVQRVELSNGGFLIGTSEHQIFVPGQGWKALGTLAYGDPVHSVIGQVDALGVVEDAGYRPVYNLEVEGEHEYYANGILVHNCLDALRYACAYLTDTSSLQEVVYQPQIIEQKWRRGY